VFCEPLPRGALPIAELPADFVVRRSRAAPVPRVDRADRDIEQLRNFLDGEEVLRLTIGYFARLNDCPCDLSRYPRVYPAVADEDEPLVNPASSFNGVHASGRYVQASEGASSHPNLQRLGDRQRIHMEGGPRTSDCAPRDTPDEALHPSSGLRLTVLMQSVTCHTR
jgi:hypothetical protein